VAKLPPLELHSGVAGIDFPRPLQKAGAGKIFNKMASTHCMLSGNDATSPAGF
jgi:hypothetical protein